MIVISFNIYLFIFFYVKYSIQSNDCDVFVNTQSILFYPILFYSILFLPACSQYHYFMPVSGEQARISGDNQLFSPQCCGEVNRSKNISFSV